MIPFFTKLGKFLSLWGLLSLVSAALCLVFSFGVMPRKLVIRHVILHGHPTEVQVTDNHQYQWGKHSASYLDFWYKDDSYSIRLEGAGEKLMRAIREKQKIYLLHLDSEPEVFVIPGTSPNAEVISVALLIVFTSYSSYYGAKKALADAPWPNS